MKTIADFVLEMDKRTKRYKELEKGCATVGLHKKEGGKIRNGVTQAQIARWIEEGIESHNQPPRPLIKTFLISPEAQTELFKVMGKYIHKGDFWKEVAQFAEKYLKKRIDDGIKPSNMPRTIKRKGFDKPWYDTGELYNDIKGVANEHK